MAIERRASNDRAVVDRQLAGGSPATSGKRAG
jgi:hypothetical protein